MANSLYTVDVVPDGLAEIGRIDVLFLPNTNRETISFCNTYSWQFTQQPLQLYTNMLVLSKEGRKRICILKRC